VVTIDPGGKFLYLVGSNSLYAFAIDAGTGALSAASGSPFSSSNMAYTVAIDPSGKYLITWGGSGASAYAIDASTGALTATGSVVTGCGGSYMAFEPSGHFLYGTAGMGGGISACSFDSGSGGHPNGIIGT
jgi:6-phosphogluconolactonase (cycloisomerase 2 family)